MKKILIIFNVIVPLLAFGQMTNSGKQAKEYWSALLVPDVSACENGFGNSGVMMGLTQDQIMQMDIVHAYWTCSVRDSINNKNGRIFQLYQTWRSSHRYHEYIQDDSAKDFFANAFGLWAMAIYMEKASLIKNDELQNVDKFYIYQFMKSHKSLLKNNFSKKYAQKSLSSAYFKLLKKENIDAINKSIYYGADVEYLLIALWLKYQDTATNLLYEETPL